MRQKAFFPIPHRFMGEFEASQQKEFGHIAKAKFVTHAAEQDLENYIGGDFDEIEVVARLLIKRAMTRFTPETWHRLGLSGAGGARCRPAVHRE